MSGKNTFSKEFSNFSRYGIAGLALLASGCTTVGKGNIVHDRFGDDCFSEFNERSGVLYVSISCSRQEMSQAQNKYPETSTSIIREVRGNRWLRQERRVPVVPNHVEADSKSSDHGHSHGDDKPVIIVPETSTGTTTSGPSSTPCGDGAHNHEHAHEVPKASSGQVTHFGCHRIDVPHTHDITNGNELGVKTIYPQLRQQ